MVSRVQAWRELTLRGKKMRAARVWHRNRVLRQQEALTEKHAKGWRFGNSHGKYLVIAISLVQFGLGIIRIIARRGVAL